MFAQCKVLGLAWCVLLVMGASCNAPAGSSGDSDMMSDSDSNSMMNGSDGDGEGDGDGDLSTEDFVDFEDPDSDFATMDVRDVDGQIVRFAAARQQLFWVEDSLTFDGWDVDGNLLARGFFTVRFGTEKGERRAYFTETSPPTICDILVNNGNLRIFSTSVTVPQE